MNPFQKLATILFISTCLSDVHAQTQTYSTAGTHAFTVPAGVISMKVECVGAGGAGGRVTPSNFLDSDAAGGGGGGAFASGLVNVTAGNNYNVTVGAGGINNGSSTNGGNSSFGDGSQVLAEGGKTRSGNDEVAGAEGGKALNSVGSVKFNGGKGGNGNENDTDGGGGGGAAGTGGNGYDGSTVTGGGNRAIYGGYGGNGGADGANGATGGNYGGGGGGSSANGSNDRNGGAGASGIVVLNWCTVTNLAPAVVCPFEQVVITGTHFTGVDSVFINGIHVSFTVDSETQITITVPANATSGPVIVSTESGRSRSVSNLNISSGSVSVSSNGMQLSAQYTGSQSATYQWINCAQGNAPISGAQLATYTASQYGLYAVTVTDNGCTATSSCYLLNNSSGIEENAALVEIKVFPNPAQSSCVVSSENEIISEINVTDLNGKNVLLLQPDSHEVQIDISALEAGCYFVHISSGPAHTVRRIVVSN